ncbi:hypothetical protein [Cyanobium sp. NS01]|uniref:hypothetical protein n=1 Tax=Cyanobium sp. NS01 TaxID=261284 RepID=UPI001645A356|nr:hypothetical protein [Cyanobium sp. NS01]QNI69489.1 hypothetical protein CyaNS01_00329 [Cyanobium sp. NS01]
MPTESLGHALARHLQDHGFDPDYYRKVAVNSDLLGYKAQPLLAQRWERGWTRPLASWRQAVGLPPQP